MLLAFRPFYYYYQPIIKNQKTMENDKKTTQKNEEKSKNTGDAKGKASMDQNGEGAAPKYGQAGTDPSETKEGAKKGKI